jgi:hypothetical protein
MMHNGVTSLTAFPREPAQRSSGATRATARATTKIAMGRMERMQTTKSSGFGRPIRMGTGARTEYAASCVRRPTSIWALLWVPARGDMPTLLSTASWLRTLQRATDSTCSTTTESQPRMMREHCSWGTLSARKRVTTAALWQSRRSRLWQSEPSFGG